MKFDKLKVSKRGAYTLVRDGKTYALVASARPHTTGCDGCAFRNDPGDSACPKDSIGGRKINPICGTVEESRLRGTNRVAIWLELA